MSSLGTKLGMRVLPVELFSKIGNFLKNLVNFWINFPFRSLLGTKGLNKEFLKNPIFKKLKVESFQKLYSRFSKFNGIKKWHIFPKSQSVSFLLLQIMNPDYIFAKNVGGKESNFSKYFKNIKYRLSFCKEEMKD